MSRVIVDLAAKRQGGGGSGPLLHPAGVTLPFEGPADAALIIPEIRSEIRSGIYSSSMIEMLPQAVQPGDRVLVIGAGLGVVSTLIGKTEGVERVIAVEANTMLVPYLARVNEANGVGNVEPVNAVLAQGKKGRVPFFVRRDLRASSLVPHDRSWQQVMMVPFMDIDLILSEEQINLVVCDIPAASAQLLTEADLSHVDRILLGCDGADDDCWAEDGTGTLLEQLGYASEADGGAVLFRRTAAASRERPPKGSAKGSAKGNAKAAAEAVSADKVTSGGPGSTAAGPDGTPAEPVSATVHAMPVRPGRGKDAGARRELEADLEPAGPGADLPDEEAPRASGHPDQGAGEADLADDLGDEELRDEDLRDEDFDDEDLEDEDLEDEDFEPDRTGGLEPAARGLEPGELVLGAPVAAVPDDLPPPEFTAPEAWTPARPVPPAGASRPDPGPAPGRDAASGAAQPSGASSPSSPSAPGRRRRRRRGRHQPSGSPALPQARRLRGLAILALALALPLMLIGEIAADRAAGRAAAAREVSAEWGGAQTLTGPFMVVPVETAAGAAPPLVLLPDRLEIQSELGAEMRRRGNFDVPVYRGRHEVLLDFAPARAEALLAPGEVADWGAAALALGISEPRGLRGALTLDGATGSVAFAPGSLGTAELPGIHAPTGDPRNHAGGWRFTLELDGTGSFGLTPAGRVTDGHVRSNWANPRFGGAFLPERRAAGPDGFAADWSIPQLAHGLPQAFRGTDRLAELESAAFGVALAQPADLYDNAGRAVRYGLMLIVLTFGAIFLMERWAPRPPHVAQYALVGAAQCCFFVLLLSLAEQIGMAPAYALASAATIGLLTAYAWFGLGLGRHSAWLGGALILLHAVIYLVLSAAELALLTGAVMAFLAVAAAMWGTRNEDWTAMLRRFWPRARPQEG